MSRQTDPMNGDFTLADGTELPGVLSLDGSKSIFKLRGATGEIDAAIAETITGVLEDQKKVTLLRCFQVSCTESFGEDSVSFRYGFFAHEVILGKRHLSSDDAVISSVSFAVDDIAVFFPQTSGVFDTTRVKPKQMSELIASNNNSEGKALPTIGKRPHIAYYTDAGGGEIFSVDTVIGNVSAINRVEIKRGNSDGAQIKNRVRFVIRFDTPVTVRQMHSRLGAILQFLDLVIGRPQNLLEIKANLTGGGLFHDHDVHFTMQPSYERSARSQKLYASNVLINTLNDTEAICQVMSAWLDKNRSRPYELARSVFYACWRKGRSFRPDRLAAAANAFDFLPSDQLPKEPIEKELEPLIKNFRQAVLGLDPSIQRENVLNATACARISAPRLKDKIRYRAKVVTAVIEEKLPEFERVIGAAVDCRNFIVHGPSSDDHNRNARMERIARRPSIFLTKTLEFIFGVSDLVDAGWDLLDWTQKDRGFGHPFHEYLRSYPTELAEFKKAWEGQDEQDK